MSIPLKANTASQELVLGPFLDKTDGVTPETGISAPTAARIWKNGVTSTINLSTGRTPAWTHDGDGFYTVGSLATDVDTKGRLRIEVTDAATHLPVWENYSVLDENTYEALITGTAYGSDDKVLISTDAQDLSATLDVNTKTITANAIGAAAIATDAITAAKIAANAITSSEIANGAITASTFAVGAIDAAAIANGAIDGATFAANALDAAALATDAVNEIRDAVTGGAYALDTDANGRIRIVDGTAAGDIDTASGRVQITEAQIDQIVDETWDELQSAHVTAGSFGEIATEIASILADTGTDGVVLANDAITAAKIAANAIGASELAADAANEIADALLDRANAIETSITLRQSLRAILSASAGKLSGAATTTVSIRDTGDTKNRIVATVDANGNRSAVTLDLT